MSGGPLWVRGGSAIAIHLARSWVHNLRALFIGLAVVAALMVPTVLRGESDVGRMMFGLIAGILPVGVGLLAMSGIVAGELESGLVVMWFQKSGSILRTYAVRYAVTQVLLVAFGLSFGIVLGAVGTATGVTPLATGERLPIVAAALTLYPAAVVFGFSAFGVRRDAIVALSFMFASVYLSAMGASPTLSTPSTGIFHTAIKLIAVPANEIQVLSGKSPLGMGSWEAASIVAGHLAAWTVVGFLGLLFTQRSLERGRGL